MKIKDFTPVFDSLVIKYKGVSTALVYGKIWRYCEWSPMGICTASNKRLAEELDLSEMTIRRAKDVLQADGYIKVVGKSGGTDSVTVCHELALEITGLPEVVHSERGVEHDERTTPYIVNDKDINIKDTSKDIKQNYADALERGAKLSNTIQMDFQNHLGLSPNWDTKTNQAHYQFFRERYEAGQTAKDFADWWRDDWKGEGGSLPASINQVQSLWFQAFVKSDPLQLSAIERGAKKVYE